MYNVRILKDSLAPCGKRLTTWILTYPRMVHAELMTHRFFSRNAASSRAIPIMKMILQVLRDPAYPLWWGANQAGMQARAELTGWKLWLARQLWFKTRYLAIAAAWLLWKVGLHKQIANRLLEPWMFITIILSSTEYDNFFHQRDHKDAQPEIAWVAAEMHRQYVVNIPDKLASGEWHLPFIEAEDRTAAEFLVSSTSADEVIIGVLKKVSVGRCARISFLTHDGRRELKEDVGLHDKLLAGFKTGDPLHMSPFEHVAQAMAAPVQSGNFRGFYQYRKEFVGEHFGSRMP